MVVLSSKLMADVKTTHSGIYGRGIEEKVQATDKDGKPLFDDDGMPRMIRTGSCPSALRSPRASPARWWWSTRPR